MLDEFPYLGEIDGWGDKPHPAMFMHYGNKYEVKIIYQATSLIEAHRELFGPHSVTVEQNGHAIYPAPFITPKRLLFKSPCAPMRAFILYPSGKNKVSQQLGSASFTIVLEIHKFMQAPSTCCYE